MLKRLFPPKEVKAIFDVIDEADTKFNHCVGFKLVREYLERIVHSDPGAVAKKVREGLSPRQITYSLIANVSGDMLESGDYHVYRGVLNPMVGEDLLRVFDGATDEGVAMGAEPAEKAERNKAAIRKNIANVG